MTVGRDWRHRQARNKRPHGRYHLSRRIGVAVWNQVRSSDLDARIRAGSARYVETLDKATTNAIVSRVLSVIEPEE